MGGYEGQTITVHTGWQKTVTHRRLNYTCTNWLVEDGHTQEVKLYLYLSACRRRSHIRGCKGQTIPVPPGHQKPVTNGRTEGQTIHVKSGRQKPVIYGRMQRSNSIYPTGRSWQHIRGCEGQTIPVPTSRQKPVISEVKLYLYHPAGRSRSHMGGCLPTERWWLKLRWDCPTMTSWFPSRHGSVDTTTLKIGNHQFFQWSGH